MMEVVVPHGIQTVSSCFYRADQIRSRETRGSGLGLAIAKWIAEKHGGSIEVESRLQQGSVFLVRIPLAEDHRDAAEGERTALRNSEATVRT